MNFTEKTSGSVQFLYMFSLLKKWCIYGIAFSLDRYNLQLYKIRTKYEAIKLDIYLLFTTYIYILCQEVVPYLPPCPQYYFSSCVRITINNYIKLIQDMSLPSNLKLIRDFRKDCCSQLEKDTMQVWETNLLRLPN